MIRVAGLQTDICWEDPKANYGLATGMARQAAEAGARLIALPEMFATGFTMNTAKVTPEAEATRDFLAGLSTDLGCWLLGGYPEAPADPQQNSRALNAASLFDPAGRERLRYHKIHPFSLAGENQHYAGGKRLPTIEIEGLRMTPVICYDLRFGELFRARAAETELFVVIANWPAPRRLHWQTLLRARAIENQAWVLGVNRVGEGDGLPYAGDSMLVDPLGEIHASAAGQAAIVGGAVDAETVADVRARFSFLSDRRPEVYRQLDALAEPGQGLD